MQFLKKKRVAQLLVFFAALCFFGGQADASVFSIEPVRLDLTRGDTSTTLLVKNHGVDAMRIQAVGESWDQRSDGSMVLTPSDDVVIFPEIFTVPPGGTQRIRIGSTAQATKNERSYRILLAELPSRSLSNRSSNVGIVILTHISIPLFISPTIVNHDIYFLHSRVTRDSASIELFNSGSVHELTGKVKVRLIASSGRILLIKSFPGWYVLSQEHRVFEVPLQKGWCGALPRIEAETFVDGKSLVSKLAPTFTDCRESN